MIVSLTRLLGTSRTFHFSGLGSFERTAKLILRRYFTFFCDIGGNGDVFATLDASYHRGGKVYRLLAKKI